MTDHQSEHHHPSSKKPLLNEEQGKMLVISLLVLILIIAIYGVFFKKDSLWLETLKAGGPGNFALTEQIYSSDAYKSQQEKAINQALTMFTTNAGQQNAATQ
jgi:hypothetical protein